MKNEIFFSKNRKLDIHMIWDHDKYWKTSPVSTLKGFNNGLTIFDDLDEILNKIWVCCKIRLKLKIWSFFENYRKSTSGLLGSLWYVRKWKKHVRKMFPWCWYGWKILKMKLIFQIFWIFFMLFFIKGFLCIIPLRAFLMLEIPWLFKQKMNFKKFSIGRMQNLTEVCWTNLGSKNSFSLSFWALGPYFAKLAKSAANC